MRQELVDLARRQQGLLTDAQLTYVDPDWREVQPGVFAPAVLVLNRDQLIQALHLHLERRCARTGRPWSFAGPTAAAMLGLRVPERPPVVVVQGTLGDPLAGDRWLMRDYGVTVLRVTPRQIRDEPPTIVRDIVAAYRRAERRFGPQPAA